MMSVLADEPKNTGPEFGKASPVGLLIVVVLLICVFILVWSMNRHLKRLPDTFDRQPSTPEQAADDATVTAVVEEATEKDGGTTGPETEGLPREPGG